MTCSVASAASYESCAAPPQGLFGYPGSGLGGASLDPSYALVAARNKPSGAPADFAIVAEACLRARGLIYFRNNPGDCGAPPGVPSFTSGQIVGLSGGAASGVVGGLGSVGALTGAATAGIGTAVSLAVAGIESIFQHHAQAVTNEQTTICAVAGYFNPLVKQIDASVASGQISASDGITYMKQVAQQAINGLQSINGVCNAACVYIGVLKAHMDFVSTYYPAISPAESIGASAPGGAPTFFGTPPGGVTAGSNLASNSAPPPPIRATFNNTYSPAIPAAPNIAPNSVLPGNPAAADYLNVGYKQQTGQSAQAADVPSTTNWAMWGAIAAIIVALLAVFGMA